jgi:hypothetical protein
MAGILSPIGGAGAQFFNNAGVVLAGGQLFTYAAGSTTPLATYTDSTLAVANGNPVVLDSSGRPTTEIWLQNNTAYKFVLKDANSNTIGTWDNITGINSSNSTVSEWVVNGLAVSYSNATTFTVAGNQTSIFGANRRIQYGLSGGTFYGYVGSSSYDGVSTTTVVIVPDTTNLNSTLSYVNQGFLNPTNPSIPQQYLTSLAPINIAQSNSNNVTYSSVNGTGTNYAGAGWGVSANGQTLNFYMTPTQTTSASATAAVLSYAWSSYRPLSVNVGTGVVSLDATGVGTNVGPSATGTTVLPLVGGGYGAIYPSVVTPSATNYAMAYNGTTTVVNGPNTAILAGGSGTISVSSGTTTVNTTLTAAGQIGSNYAGIGLYLNGVASSSNKIQFAESGVTRGYLQSTATTPLAVVNAGNSINVMSLDQVGNLTLASGQITFAGTGVITANNAGYGMILRPSADGATYDFTFNNSAAAILFGIDKNGNGYLTGSLKPSTTGGIVGTTLGDSANAGSVGEVYSAFTNSKALTANVITTLVSITVPAGDWDVYGVFGCNSTTGCAGGISAFSTTLPAASLQGGTQGTGLTESGSACFYPPTSTNSSFTFYLNIDATNTATGYGCLWARRRR